MNDRTKDDEPIQSMEEMYKSGRSSERSSDDSDIKSEYDLPIVSDAHDDDRIQVKVYEKVSQHGKYQEWISQNMEKDVLVGGTNWQGYVHERDIEIDNPMKLWEALKEQDAGHSQVEVQNSMNEDHCLECAQVEGGLEMDHLSGDITQVKGTGRPDLDDGEDDFGIADEMLIPQSHSTTCLDICQCRGSGRPDLDADDAFLDDQVTQDPRLGAVHDFWEATSRTSEWSLENDFSLEAHAQDEPKLAVTSGSSKHLDGKVTLEAGMRQQRNESDGSDRLHRNCSGKNHFLEPQSNSCSVVSSGTKMKLSNVEGKDDGEGISSMLYLIPGISFQGNGDTTQYDACYDAQEDYLQPCTESAGDGVRQKGRVVHLGSKEAEELHHMDIRKVGRAVYTLMETPLKLGHGQDRKRAGVDWAAEDLGPDELSRYVEALEVKETYIDTVSDMEDVLFDADEGTGARVFQVGKNLSSAFVRPARDGSASASTSSNSTLVAKQLGQLELTLTEVDWVEIVGALQRRGGASLGERVVGVREYTVYRIRVKGGGNEWEIQRRYRDFVALYHQLLQLSVHREGYQLPPPWEKVKAASRKVFGNTSPDVVEVRSALIQVCLQSLLQAGPPLSTATPLIRFLFPEGGGSSSIETDWRASGKHVGEGLSGLHGLSEGFVISQQLPKSDASSGKSEQEGRGDTSAVFGKTIQLIVQIPKKQPLKQKLQMQHYTCAGCYKHLELALGLLPELIQNWGWGGPRVCEYSGQLFCSACHLNETAVIPAWVLQQWDFAPRQVCQLAKAYLDSIYDKPMLCGSAVNPYLYARVPVLAHLTKIRRKVSKMLVCIRCPARARIQAMMGSRRYLLENNDFFSLRDLADLSKGAFAVLPGFMRAMLLKLSIHITRECSACQELGEACGARDLCDDPFDVIYPYQDENVTRCQSCHRPYHKKCFYESQKVCSCRNGQSVEMREDSLSSSDVLVSQIGVVCSLSTDLPSSVPLEREVPSVSSSFIAGDNIVKSKKNLLASFKSSKDAQCSEFLIKKWNSDAINMSELHSTQI